jgi:hypothetical protein
VGSTSRYMCTACIELPTLADGRGGGPVRRQEKKLGPLLINILYSC